jgi:uncharacterized membrane protein
MKPAMGRHVHLERILAVLLDRGTWIASLIVAAGLVLHVLQPRGIGPAIPAGAAIVNLGVALFILLPVVRVSVMLLFFGRERDYRYAAIAAGVLTIVVLGAVLGWRSTVSRGG